MTRRITASEAERSEALRQPVQLDDYQRAVAKALTKAFDADSTAEQEIDLDSARIVVMSDHHKGGRDGADDFRGCEPAYTAALAYYLETEFRLFALGDAEELWECSAKEVLKAYADTLALEAQFHVQGRYERFWGNHDHQWGSANEVEKHLAAVFPGLRVREALKMRVVRGREHLGLLFFAHGHQGTLDSDKLSWLSRPVVRHIWRPLQRRLDMRSTNPSRDFKLRRRHDAAMFSWARTHPARPVLVAGHTHRPVFWTSQAPVERTEQELARELDELRAKNGTSPEALGEVRARLEFLRAANREKGPPPLPIDPPCYFNTGCCSFGDGDVTAIEIAGGEIRLVRWPNDDGEPLPKLLVQADLAEVLERVAGAGRPVPDAQAVPALSR